MKFCSKCNKNKSNSEYAWKNKDKEKRSAECKECHKEYNRQYYIKNHSKERERLKKMKNDRKEWFKDHKKKLKCKRCGENKPATLQFHHSSSDKESNISSLVARTAKIDTILREIKKCEVLCANCHMEEHHGHLYV